MSALFFGHAASSAVLAFSPWLIPLLAVAAKLTYDEARGAFRQRPPSPPARQGGDTPKRPRGNWDVMHDRFKARLAARVWPE